MLAAVAQRAYSNVEDDYFESDAFVFPRDRYLPALKDIRQFTQ